MRWLLLWFAASCVQTGSEQCSDGRICPEGTRCFAIESLATIECITQDQLDLCDAQADTARCDNDTGTCYGGACLPAGCGNARVDFAEACDDGGNVPGDGCSADCRSDETCGNGIVDPVRNDNGVFVANELCDDGALVGHDGCSSSCDPEVARTVNIARIPAVRVDTAMVTDEAAHRVIMFGGRVGQESARVTNDTWELADDGWVRLRSEPAPAPRAAHAMAFDGSQIILFGGDDGAQELSDTWSFAKGRWTQLPVTGPKPRRGHAMAYLPGTGIVMFGGYTSDGLVTDETWVFDTGTWRRLSLAMSPPARTNHTLTLDPVRRTLVLTAGVTSLEDSVVDTWEFDGIKWTQFTPAMIPPYVYATAAYDRVRGRVLLEGGRELNGIIAGGEQPSPNTYAWDGQTWTLVASNGAGMSKHASAVDPDTGEMVTFGGLRIIGVPCDPACPLVHDETYRFEGDGWAPRPFIELGSASGTAASTDPLRQRAVVLTVAGATVELGAGSWLSRAFSGPGARSGSAMAYGRAGSAPSTILFGGYTNAVKQDTWAWNGAAWAQQSPMAPLPPARHQHAMAYDAKRARTVLFGGAASGPSTTPIASLGDTWEWTGSRWVAIGGPQPTARSEHAMAYDPIRGVILVFGGRVNGNPIGDLWQLDDAGWTRLEPPLSPGPRYGAAMAWDAARKRVVLVGGAPSFDTWEWDGTNWAFVTADVVEELVEHSLVSSPTGAGVIAIGGTVESPRSDTVHYVWATSGAYAACRSPIDDDEDGLAGCDDPDCWASCAPLCAPGTSCDPAAPRCGDGACEPTREDCGLCPTDCPCTSP